MCMHTCVCIGMCVYERVCESDGPGYARYNNSSYECVCVCVCVHVSVCVCVCMRAHIHAACVMCVSSVPDAWN